MSLSPSRSSKKRVSKDEKICQLKSNLKISRENNLRLKKEIERLKNATGNTNTSNTTVTPSASSGSRSQEEQQKKFREAMRAMKKVTVNQEICIKTLKNRGHQRRKEMKQKDAQIAAAEQKVKSLETADKVLKKSKGDKDLQSKVRELQLAYDEAIHRKNDLEELLDEKDAQMEAVQKQRNSLMSPLRKLSKKAGYNSDGGSASVGSGQSGSTSGDFAVAKLKTELAKKSDKIMKLELDLEMVQDELHDMKQKKGVNGDAFASGGSSFFPPPTNSLSFMMGQHQQRQPSGGTRADDWTADDTDCESEFGESFFGGVVGAGAGRQEVDDNDFW